MAVDSSVPVVLFRADNYCSLGIVRSLGRLGARVIGLDPDPGAIALKSRYCAGHYAWNFETSDEARTLEFLEDVARKVGNHPVLLATFDERNLFVDRHRDRLSRSYRLPPSAPGAMARLYSKQGMHDLCGEQGVPTARTLFPRSREEAMQGVQGLRFPVVVKAIDPNRLMRFAAGLRMAVVADPADLGRIYASLDEPGVPNLAVQELIRGGSMDRWAIAAYFGGDGECRFAVTGRKLRQLPVSGGVTSLAVTAPCQEIEHSLARLIQAVGYRGIIGADYCFDPEDGLYKLLDINPRLGANFRAFVDVRGLDAARALYLDLTGQPVPPASPMAGRRWLVEDKDFWAAGQMLREGSLTASEWIRSLRGVSEFAHWATDDLRPGLMFAGHFASDILCSGMRFALRNLGLRRAT